MLPPTGHNNMNPLYIIECRDPMFGDWYRSAWTDEPVTWAEARETFSRACGGWDTSLVYRVVQVDMNDTPIPLYIVECRDPYDPHSSWFLSAHSVPDENRWTEAGPLTWFEARKALARARSNIGLIYRVVPA